MTRLKYCRSSSLLCHACWASLPGLPLKASPSALCIRPLFGAFCDFPNTSVVMTRQKVHIPCSLYSDRISRCSGVSNVQGRNMMLKRHSAANHGFFPNFMHGRRRRAHELPLSQNRAGSSIEIDKPVYDWHRTSPFGRVHIRPNIWQIIWKYCFCLFFGTSAKYFLTKRDLFA